MTMTIVIGWWIIPALISVGAIVWFHSKDYSGSYNFNALFTAPVTAFFICAAWMIYFGIGWALS